MSRAMQPQAPSQRYHQAVLQVLLRFRLVKLQLPLKARLVWLQEWCLHLRGWLALSVLLCSGAIHKQTHAVQEVAVEEEHCGVVMEGGAFNVDGEG